VKIAKILLIGAGTILVAALVVVSDRVSKIPEEATTGPQPVIPKPSKRFIPTISIADAKGWPLGAKPIPASGLTVNAYASGLDHPRWLYVLPNGDVLVAETNAPPRPEAGGGIKGWIFKMALGRAGAATTSANRITLLRDADGDGIAETRTTFLRGLNSPFGMALIGSNLYVANTDAILRFTYTDGATQITASGIKSADLPAGPLNHHWTKSLIASPDWSPSLCRRGLEQQCRRERS
jgi:glucose/arabinose dehydrogenase